VSQADDHVLVHRDVYSGDTCHVCCPEAAKKRGILLKYPWFSTLPLLVPRIFADHVDDATSPHDLAVLTNLFY
jgi:hypothetical protein